MHRSLLVLAALTFIVSCSEEDPPALFAAVAYQVRCIDCQPTTTDSPVRDLAVVDGEDDTSLRCESVNNLVSLEIINSEYAFEILNAKLGDEPGDQCEVRVKEGINEYRGDCRPVGSDGSAACEVELTQDGSGFNGTVLCNKIQHKSNAGLFRYVVAPRSMDEPVDVSVQGCAGL